MGQNLSQAARQVGQVIIARAGQAREKQEISSLTDLELSKQLGNAKSNISKGKNELEKAPDEEKRVKAMEKTRKWTERKNLLEAEMESRKKN